MRRRNLKLTKVVLIALSVIILIIPDIMLHFKNDVLSIGVIISKICLLIAMGILLLKVVKSYFYVYLLLGIPYILSSVAEVINIVAVNWYISSDGLKALYYLSDNELVEFFEKFRVYFVIPILLLVCYSFVLKRYKSFNNRVLINNKLIVSAFVLIAVSVGLSFLKLRENSEFYSGKNRVRLIIRSCYIYEHPFNFYYRTARLMVHNHRNKKSQVLKSQFQFNVNQVADNRQPEIVIFVIGEAMRYKNWSVNGYCKETSPGLKQLNNLVSYSKHYSNANCTANAFPLLLTQASAQTYNDAFVQKTIVSLFKEAGYQTSWISSSSGALRYLDNRDEADFFYNLRTNYPDNTDFGIIPTVDEILRQSADSKQFIVINMRGAHERPPVSFDTFTPNSNLEDFVLSIENANIFINDYDNTILFQDYVLTSVIKKLEDKEKSSFFLFTSDHATHLFDAGHSLFGYGAANPTEIETHIPLFIWCSNKYLDDNWTKFDNIQMHKEMLSTNDNLFYTLADLANIKYQSFIRKLSLADSLFVEPHSRYVYANNHLFEFNNKYSYDSSTASSK
ncbi:phosphoethanolamine transferase [Carboxylicivirga sp. A043]|uniref:phosphoethanolamine transferase n=1 Tax=Carboxylicivirga litoralis TaxID=2816963 RepID=UPI0021CB1E6B|nr:phosphoethanolamine transferase [Carboxylicivirga sp. A043]MCU4155362.1 phosphoethanolamine transferase [Carboxylicivirga sp. A043]